MDSAQGLRVVLVSKALVVGAYQRKAEEIARCGVTLTVFTPPEWGDSRGKQPAEALHTHGYTLGTLPVRLGGNFHLHHYPTLRRELARLRPHILHMDEEPYNYATWHALRSAAATGARGTFFTWQNLNRRYPPPFRQMEQGCYRLAPAAMAGSEDAASVLRAKGYAGAIEVIPQFGVDTAIFCPQGKAQAEGPLRIGYVGGLLPEKGVDLLLRAAAQLRGAWTLHFAGEGSERAALEAHSAALGIAARVAFAGRVASAEMPEVYRALDVLVLPSRSRPNWKEQFGRVLIEAMACGVPVIGSQSGEIPNVIGEAGLLFAEEDVDGLRDLLQLLLDSPAERARLAEAGRRRVLERYTMAHIARQTVAFYERLLALPAPRS